MNAINEMEPDMGLDGRSVYRHGADIVSRKVGHEAVLVPIRQNVGNLDFVYTLSPVAARIWSLLDGVRSIDDIVTAICQEYDASRDTVEADVAELVSDLQGVSLIIQVS